MKLRDYQEEAVGSVLTALSRGIKRPAVVLATGGGKTVVFSHLIPKLKDLSSKDRPKSLVLAHREELVRQAAGTIQRVNPKLQVSLDMKKFKPTPMADVIVGSVPTLIRKTRLEKYDPSQFHSIILDECHHATANSWVKILKYFGADTPKSEINVVGFTATMERGDGQSLGTMFDEIVYERSLLEMVTKGELVDVKFSSIESKIDLDKVAMKASDYDVNSLATKVNTSENNVLIALSYAKLRKEFGFKSTLIFCVNIDHCKTLCGVLQSKGINAQYVSGLTCKQTRLEILEDFKNGKIDVLCNVSVFTEGTDIPNVDSLILARPTKSRPLLVQMIGRGLRLHAEKKHCHVIDLADTLSTGTQSVPTLFCLPPEYSIDGKTYAKLSEESEEYQLKLEEEEKTRLQQKEIERRREEQATKDKLDMIDNNQNMLALKLTTVDGFMELNSREAGNYKKISDAISEIKKSKQKWIALDYCVWGLPARFDTFFLIARQEVNNSIYFRLTLNRFISIQQRLASKFKCGKHTIISEISMNQNLKQVITQAESMKQRTSNDYFSKTRERPPTKKQLDFLKSKLKKKASSLYPDIIELDDTLGKELQKFTSQRVLDLIFALKYSTNSLWVTWELNKLLGPSKKTSSLIKKLSKADIDPL